MNLITYPHQSLTTKCFAVSRDQDVANLVDLMMYEMINSSGVGISAPQVGANLRIVIIDEAETIVMINPVILSSSDESSFMKEGCLSFPNLFVDVKRCNVVNVQYDDQNMISHVKKFDGMMSRIVQHEIEHLDGITLLDKMAPAGRSLAIKNILRMKKGIYT